MDEIERVLAGVDAGAAPDGSLCAAAVVLARLESLVAAVKGLVLAELDARRVCETDFGLTTGSWLARSPRRIEKLRAAGGVVMIGLGVRVLATGRAE